MSVFSVNKPTYFKYIPKIILKRLDIKFGYMPHSYKKTNISKDAVSFASTSISKYGTVADFVSLKQYFKEISNQYNLGSCVANAVADTAEAIYAKQFNMTPIHVPDFSRLFVYYNARNNQTPPAADVDEGTYISLAVDSIKRYGIPHETVWPYDTKKVFTRPSVLSYRTALTNRFFNYYSINSSGDDRINDISKALNAGYPVMFGTKVDYNFLDLSGSAIVGPPSGNYAGGHAMVIVGKSNNNFEIRNSWGKSWGDNGYTFFTPEYLKADITSDIWVLVSK